MIIGKRAWITVTFLLAAHVAYVGAGPTGMVWQVLGGSAWLLSLAWLRPQFGVTREPSGDGLARPLEAGTDRPAAMEREPAIAARLEQFERRREQRDRLLEHCRPATADEYDAWLRGYRKRGGRVTHYRDWPMHHHYYVMLSDPGWIPKLYGANSVEVIVPRGVMSPAALSGGTGHSQFFFMDGFKVVGGGVESFTDARGA